MNKILQNLPKKIPTKSNLVKKVSVDLTAVNPTPKTTRSATDTISVPPIQKWVETLKKMRDYHDQEHIAEVKKRYNSGYYDKHSEEVSQKIAEQIMSDWNI